MTGIRPQRLMLQIMPERVEIMALCNLNRAEAERIISIETLQEALHAMYKDVGIHVEERRRRAIQAHNTATNIVCPNIVIGDFLVVCKAVRPKHKL